MKWYEILLVFGLLFLVFKRVEGYTAGERLYVSGGMDGNLDSLYIAGGRSSEFFKTTSPSNWQPKTPGYIFDDTVEMDI